MEKHKKTVHALALPYPVPQWPSVSPYHEAAILALLLPLLQPIGDFRNRHAARSRGKGRVGKPPGSSGEEQISPHVTMPEFITHLTIGFNTTIRKLEALSQVRRPSSFSKPQRSSLGSSQAEPTNLFAVLVCRRSFPEVLTSSIPSMLVTAAAKPSRARLIDISPQSEAKIAEALKQPRVGVLGIEFDAPGVNNLSRFVLENIHEIDIPWLEQQSVPTYLPVNIESTAIVPKSKSSTDTRKRKRKTHEASTHES